MPTQTILIVDDETVHRLMLRARLEAEEFRILEAIDGQDALGVLETLPVDLMLLDIEIPGLDGLGFLQSLQQRHRFVPTIIMTSHRAIDNALQATAWGVDHYLARPVDPDELVLKIQETLSLHDIKRIRTRRAADLNRKFNFSFLLGQSQPLLELKEMLSLAAPSDIAVLITGEPGSGKELAAQTIFSNSARKNRPFMTVSCEVFSDTLLESEIFGHERGAFSGADRRKQGRLELADQGTLFLDEIGDMPPNIQSRLIRALESRSFERMGGPKAIYSDVRLLAATSLDLEMEMENGRFRRDLYHRLNRVRIQVPSLRERGPGDIRILAEHFLRVAAERNHREEMTFSPIAMRALQASPWPGNVRELINAVDRSVILAGKQVVEFDDLPLTVQNWSQTRDRLDTGRRGIRPGMTIKQVEAELIGRTLADTGGNRSKAADMLGITRQTLLNKIKEYGLYA